MSRRPGGPPFHPVRLSSLNAGCGGMTAPIVGI
jgi:hypothetical protein